MFYYSHSIIQFLHRHVVFTFLSLSLTHSFVCLLLSVFILPPLALLFSSNGVWTRGILSTVLAAAVGQWKRDRESKQWGDLADAPCYFSSTSHWLRRQWPGPSTASELRGARQHALFSSHRAAFFMRFHFAKNGVNPSDRLLSGHCLQLTVFSFFWPPLVLGPQFKKILLSSGLCPIVKYLLFILNWRILNRAHQQCLE